MGQIGVDGVQPLKCGVVHGADERVVAVFADGGLQVRRRSPASRSR